jgi:Ni,Fe-hydrogenase III large subunit
LNFRKKNENLPQSQILFFERSQKGNKVYQLKIKDNGELPLDQPKGYRDFFIKEELRLLGL